MHGRGYSKKPSGSCPPILDLLANKAGRLLELIRILHSRQVHVVALTILDTTDSSIVRMVVDDPDQARAIFHEQAVAHTESTVVAVEVRGSYGVAQSARPCWRLRLIF